MKNKSNSSVKVKKDVQLEASFHTDFTTQQKTAWVAYQKHDLLFLTGAPGTGKTHVAVTFAIHDLLKNKSLKKIIITRPVVEAGESLGYLPGSFEEKVDPYMRPIYDCINTICGPREDSEQKEKVLKSVEVCPIAYSRGRTFNDAIVIFDESQNATQAQFKLIISRLGKNSKMIITGDPDQSDLPGNCALPYVVEKVSNIKGVACVHFDEQAIVRHPLIAEVIKAI